MVYFSKYASVNIFIYPSFNITNLVNDRCISTFMVAKSIFINKFKSNSNLNLKGQGGTAKSKIQCVSLLVCMELYVCGIYFKHDHWVVMYCTCHDQYA